MKGFPLPSPAAIAKIRKKYNLSNGSRLTAAQFREALDATSNKEKNKSASAYNFTYHLIERTEDKVVIFIEGKHISNNRFFALPLGKQISYKMAFKKAADAFYLRNMKIVKKYPSFSRALISFKFHQSVRSRDHDNNAETQKRIQDTLVRLGFVDDDTRSHIEKREKDAEIIVPRGSEGITVLLIRRQ